MTLLLLGDSPAPAPEQVLLWPDEVAAEHDLQPLPGLVAALCDADLRGSKSVYGFRLRVLSQTVYIADEAQLWQGAAAPTPPVPSDPLPVSRVERFGDAFAWSVLAFFTLYMAAQMVRGLVQTGVLAWSF